MVKKGLRFHAENEVKRVVLLSLFLLLGMIGGNLLAGSITGQETEYLRDYVLGRSEPAAGGDVLYQTLWAYLRTVPLLVLLGSCATVGAVGVLVVCSAQSVIVSFTASAFAMALGREGVLLCLAVLGIRCLFVFPATVYVAAAAIRNAVEHSETAKAALYRRAVVSGTFLLLGAVLELLLAPLLLRLLGS